MINKKIQIECNDVNKVIACVVCIFGDEKLLKIIERIDCYFDKDLNEVRYKFSTDVLIGTWNYLNEKAIRVAKAGKWQWVTYPSSTTETLQLYK